MLYIQANNSDRFDGDEMAKLHTAQVIEILGITRVTLNKWISNKKIKKVTWRDDLGFKYREFDSAEIHNLKAHMVKTPAPGKPLIPPKKKKRR